MIEIEIEGIVFIQAFLSGMIMYSSYNCIRKFRRVIRHNLVVIAIEDILFWIGMSIFLSVQIYNTSDGNIRWYFVLGAILGCSLCICGERCMKNINKFHKNY